MSGESMPTSTNPFSKVQLPLFVEMLDTSQKNIIKGLWDVDDLSISDKIDAIDLISKEMPKETREEYRKWRFLIDRDRMPDFYDFQNNDIKMIIVGIFEKSTNLEEFARTIMSMKSSLNNPDAFDKWMKNEEIEFEEPPIQEDINKDWKVKNVKNLFKSTLTLVMDLFHWRDLKKSEVITLALSLLFLFILERYPILSVIVYTGLAVLAATLGFRSYKAIEALIKKTGSENPFQAFLNQDHSFPRDRIHSQVDVLVEHGSHLANVLKRLVFVENIVDSVTCGFLLWLLTYIVSWFSGFTLGLLTILGIFSISKFYGTHQKSTGHPRLHYVKLPPFNALDLIYWRDPEISGTTLALLLFFFFIFGRYPILSVIVYTGLVVLAATLGFRSYKAIEALIQKTGSENPFQTCLNQDLSFSRDRIHSQVDVLIEHGSHLVNQLKRLIFVENIIDSVKCGLLLWLLTYIVSWFSGFTLGLLTILGIFSIPKFYETRQKPINNH